MTYPFWEKPCAADGYASYRCKGRYGWIMIGANSHAEALNEALRSDSTAKMENLEIWNGTAYEKIS